MPTPSPLFAFVRLLDRVGWVGVVAFLLLALISSGAQAADGVVVVQQARFVLADDETPPPDSRAWVDVKLPDNWSTSRRNVQGLGWYRMGFDHSGASADRTAVLVPRISINGEIFVNGVRVLAPGTMADPPTRNWNVPFYVEIPAPLLRAGANTVDIRVFAYRNNNGGLGSVYIGEPKTLQPQHAWLDAIHVKGALLSFAVATLAAFIGIVAWLRMGRSAVYGFFGLAMVAWAVRYLNYFVQDVPFNHLLYSTIVNSAQGWFFIFFTQFLLRLTNRTWPLVEKGLYTVGALGTAAIFATFAGVIPLWPVMAVWFFVWLPGAAALLAVSARYAWKMRSALAVMAAVVAWLYVPLTIRELLITSDVMPFDASYISHYVGVPLAVLISWMLIDRLVKAARAAARAELATAQAAFAERQRLTQDMHDGLGLQLNAALRVVDRGEVDGPKLSAALRACLDELRLIVDAAASSSGEFLPLLASLRIRLQSKLEAIGIRIEWHMHQFPDALVLPAPMSLHILRIVQEAINNTIKHTRASTITFSQVEAMRPGHIGLRVSDNGGGFKPDAGSAGKGLTGMKRRAATAGVGLHIRSADQGTAIQIDIPYLQEPS